MVDAGWVESHPLSVRVQLLEAFCDSESNSAEEDAKLTAGQTG